MQFVMALSPDGIIITTIKKFCVTLSGVLGFFIALAVVIIAMNSMSDSVSTPDRSELVVCPDAEGNRKLLPESAPVILRIDIHGVIGELDLTSQKVENLLLDSREGVLKNNRVKAILLHINTPGGLVSDDDGIYRALKEYKKKFNTPIYAFVNGLCASGGMMIAAAADKITATPDSIIGSIGVRLGPVFNYSELMKKIGVDAKTLTRGKDKDMLNPFRPWKEGEDASLQNIMKSLYERFVKIIVEARPRVNRDQLINDYGAQVYIANEAEKIGYIDDADSTYDQTIRELAAASGIDAKKYQVLKIKTSHSFLVDLVQKANFFLKSCIDYLISGSSRGGFQSHLRAHSASFRETPRQEGDFLCKMTGITSEKQVNPKNGLTSPHENTPLPFIHRFLNPFVYNVHENPIYPRFS